MSKFRKERVAQVNLDTGEVEQGLALLIPPKHRLASEFVMQVQEGYIKLAIDADLVGQDLRVLLIYLGYLDYENFLQLSQQRVADILGVKKQRVYESTQKLVQKGILIKGPKVGNHNTYRLHPSYGWKGKANKTYWDFYNQETEKVIREDAQKLGEVEESWNPVDCQLTTS